MMTSSCSAVNPTRTAAFDCCVPRDALNLVATAKGLIMGDLQFEVRWKDKQTNVHSANQATHVDFDVVLACVQLEDFADEDEADESSVLPQPLRFEIVDCRPGHPIPVHVKQIKGERMKHTR